MTTEKAIELFTKKVQEVYETLYEFATCGDLATELEIDFNDEAIYVSYTELGEGEIENVRYVFLKKVNGKWVTYTNNEIDKSKLESELKKAIKSTYNLRLEQYNEEYAYEIAQAEREYYEDMYYDNKMCLALGK